ncbi:hypothetical protein EJB05_35589 [Eragrostis curvula]|uniref:Uncharacterized protein n=1 Tax=Eragrostis curvula TaxID=38414 RepID=A0A5J9U6Z8_9POAL|nr:hypothetical protein EJB05_35589 [Eragrostis curvula]
MDEGKLPADDLQQLVTEYPAGSASAASTPSSASHLPLRAPTAGRCLQEWAVTIGKKMGPSAITEKNRNGKRHGLGQKQNGLDPKK